MVDELDLRRAAFRTQASDDAYAHLSAADAERDGLGPEDPGPAGAGGLPHRPGRRVGGDMAERDQGFLERDDVERAARSAFWLGLVLFNRGEEARTARADRWCAGGPPPGRGGADPP